MTSVKRLVYLSCCLLLLLTPLVGSAQGPAEPSFRPVRDYRLEMELNLMAPFPFLDRFGAVQLIVYPQGVRAEGLAATAVTLTGSSTVRVENPLLRLYADVPVSELGNILLRQSGASTDELLPGLQSVALTRTGEGTVKDIPATRYRLSVEEGVSIDLWTTSAIPRNEHLNAMGLVVLGAISKSAAEAVTRLPGTVLYAEVNSPNHEKLCLLRLRTLTRSSAGFEEELTSGSFFAEAPLVDRLWK